MSFRFGMTFLFKVLTKKIFIWLKQFDFDLFSYYKCYTFRIYWNLY